MQPIIYNVSGHIIEPWNILIKNEAGDLFDAPPEGRESNIKQRSSVNAIGNGTSFQYGFKICLSGGNKSIFHNLSRDRE